jgi:hypothetical protein
VSAANTRRKEKKNETKQNTQLQTAGVQRLNLSCDAVSGSF